MILVDLGSKGRGTWLIPAQFIKKKSYHDRPANRRKLQRSMKTKTVSKSKSW